MGRRYCPVDGKTKPVLAPTILNANMGKFLNIKELINILVSHDVATQWRIVKPKKYIETRVYEVDQTSGVLKTRTLSIADIFSCFKVTIRHEDFRYLFETNKINFDGRTYRHELDENDVTQQNPDPINQKGNNKKNEPLLNRHLFVSSKMFKNNFTAKETDTKHQFFSLYYNEKNQEFSHDVGCYDREKAKNILPNTTSNIFQIEDIASQIIEDLQKPQNKSFNILEHKAKSKKDSKKILSQILERE